MDFSYYTVSIRSEIDTDKSYQLSSMKSNQQIYEVTGAFSWVASNHWTGLWTGLLDWTDGLELLDLICSYHMTSIQSNVVNSVTVNALHLPTAC